MALKLKKHESPSSKDAFCQVWLNFVRWLWRRSFNVVNVIRYFAIIPPWKDMTLYLNTLKSPLPNDALYWVRLKLAQWFWRFWSRISLLSMISHYFAIASTLKQEMTLKIFENIFPSSKYVLCLGWSTLAQWPWRRRDFNVLTVFFAILLSYPFGKGQSSSFKQPWILYI